MSTSDGGYNFVGVDPPCDGCSASKAVSRVGSRSVPGPQMLAYVELAGERDDVAGRALLLLEAEGDVGQVAALCSWWRWGARRRQHTFDAAGGHGGPTSL